MKKILPMILLLSFSLPSMAAEILLKCDVTTENGKTYSRIVGFDEAAGTVTVEQNKYTVNTHHHKGRKILNIENYWNAYHINRTGFGGAFYQIKEGEDRAREGDAWEVSRMDGSYSSGGDRGKCVPFKQAF